ncbi:dihydrofolate reductase family protein [Enterococcus olivae]
MRKIVFYGAISLDGFLADEQDNLQWLFDTDLAGVSTYEAFEKNIDTVVMGRVTYEETTKMLEEEPFYLGKEKIIFSRTKNEKIEEGYFTSENPVNVLQELQKKNGKDIWIVGGGGLLSELIEADLIDEYWIQIAPVLLGKGKRLFEEGNYRQRLEFVETTQMGELTELHFRRKQE